jgi:hypothetical protein
MARSAAALAVLGALLVGCGGDEGGGGPSTATLVARAVKATQQAESYRMRFDMRSDIAGAEFAMDGVMTSSADQSRNYIKGNFSFQGNPPQPAEMISAGDVNYLRMEQIESQLPAGKKWLKVTDETPSTMTPSEFVAFLRESEEIQDVGQEEVGGRPTRHLRGPVDMQRLAESTSSQAAQQFSQIPEASKMQALVDVWIAGDDTLAKMALDISHPDAAGSINVVGDDVEYDVSLDGVEAPPDSEVADPADLR